MVKNLSVGWKRVGVSFISYRELGTRSRVTVTWFTLWSAKVRLELVVTWPSIWAKVLLMREAREAWSDGGPTVEVGQEEEDWD